MRKKLLIMAVVVGISALFITAGIYAGTKVPDVIKMENKAYKKHTKSIMMFSHKKHIEEYKAGCGECHHDDKGKPLNNLKEGDNVQNCIECHKELGRTPGKTKKEWKAKNVSKKEQKKMKLEWHAEAIHFNCIDCHKKFNKKTGTKKAPYTCAKCHPKKKK